MRRVIATLPSARAGEPSPRAACDCQVTRRSAIALCGSVGLGLACGITGARSEPADERPHEGDLLVAIHGATFAALTPSDVPPSPILAWPMQAAGNLVRSASRLNKVVLVRLDPASLTGTTQMRAAGGVVAYSAICPHAGCDVDGWVAEERILECPCHNSRYDPSNAAAIVDGPTTRPLAALPLKIADGKLAVAGAFAGRLGIAPT